MALLGAILLVEYGTGWRNQILLNGLGIFGLFFTAYWFDSARKGSQSARRPDVGYPGMRLALRQTTAMLLIWGAIITYGIIAGGAVTYVALNILSPAVGAAVN